MRKNFLSIIIALACFSGQAQAFTPTEDGLYAVFDTSMGEFTCQLYFEDTTQTVANFIGLAEGTQEWLDLTTGKIQQNHPFYDGIIFHRVIEGFMNQAGSPNGQGTDGPGYNIFDEIIFNDSNFDFSRTGLLAMANSGAANSGGSQFFVTVSQPTYLNNKHTIFGEVVDGMAVVTAINEAPTTDDKPDEDIVINSVTIIRQGSAALAFDASAYNIPTLGESDITASVVDDVYYLSFDIQPDMSYNVYSSPDLQTWSSIGSLGRYNTGTGVQAFSVGSTLPGGTQGFWSGVRTQYPSLPNGGYTIEIINASTSTVIYTIPLNSDLTGNFNQTGGTSYEINYYEWHDFGGDHATIYLEGPVVRPLQFYLSGGTTGEAILFLEATSGSAEDFITGLEYEIKLTVP
ncbi:peptidylprolyl isomerase [Cerasicoccus maritimus]|uniref:peptidylprolyl isomerase n=1 Tax=Cerasicoccus maritimus TaxID=490089 RepID=UPI002852CBCF|nr:peptidylprolyl isomerase [Cerasicoccus maritimus]